MPVYRIVENTLLDESEYRARASEIAAHLELRSSGKTNAPLSLGFGRELFSLAESAKEGLEAREVSAFTPIGIGKPLTIELRHIYTGHLPKGGRFFGKSKDMAVISGVKDYSVFAASTRALNFIALKTDSHSHLKSASAFTNGTSVIAYYSSVVSDNLTLSVELAADDFPETFIEQVSKGLEAAAEIPLLIPYAGYLLGAGVIAHLASDISNTLIDGQADYSITESIAFDSPGTTPSHADFRLLCHSQYLAAEYDYVVGQGLVHRATRELYSGDEPYVVISLDGKSRPTLENFAATAASAAVLKRFFDIRDQGSTSIDTIIEGLKLVSDMRFRNKALAVKQKIETLEDGAPERKRLQSQYEALKKNIVNSLFLPG